MKFGVLSYVHNQVLGHMQDYMLILLENYQAKNRKQKLEKVKKKIYKIF